MKVDIGIAEEGRKSVSEGLSKLLADSYILYLKTHNFHWNVEGPMFGTLHEMFMAQYTELWNALDLVAERIRALGYYAPGSFKKFSALSSIPEADEHVSASEMIDQLLKGNESVSKTIREVFPVAESCDDQSTMDLLSERLQVHEKTAWMLRALLERQT